MKTFEIFPKEWTANHRGHEIRVRNSWNRGIALYVDGVAQGSSKQFFALSSTSPVLTHRVEKDGSSFLLEVFCRALFTVKAKILADGRQIAGDEF